MKKLNNDNVWLKLRRYPETAFKDRLSAWDASDAYIYEQFDDYNLLDYNRILIIHDAYGALTTSIANKNEKENLNLNLLLYNDYFNSSESARKNLIANDLKKYLDVVCESFSDLELKVKSKKVLVLLKIPRSVDALDYTLLRLSSVLGEGSSILASGMVKHLPKSTREILSKYCKEVNIHRVEKKALLFSCSKVKSIEVNENKKSNDIDKKVDFISENFETRVKKNFEYNNSKINLKLTSLPGVFAGSKLDKGTSLLLKVLNSEEGVVLPEKFKNQTIKKAIDLGCGCGVVGLCMASLWEQAIIVGIDVYEPAIASARLNAEANKIDNIIFKLGDGLNSVEDSSIDLVVSNPPFHSHSAIDRSLTKRLFEDVNRCLKDDGYFLLVGNIGLSYSRLLRSNFNNVKIILEDNRYQIFLCENKS